MIDGATRLYGLLGDPVEHSLSPRMHNTAFRMLGLNCVYLAFRVEAGNLAPAIQAVRTFGMRGVNITMPHKTSVLPLLDEIDPQALKIGAVNTIVNKGGKLAGFNTDAGGFSRLLSGTGLALRGSKAVLLGSGGAARAVGYALAEAGADLVILNRPANLPRASSLALELAAGHGIQAAALALNETNLAAALAGAGLLVNATSCGMSPRAAETPVPAALLTPGLTVADIVYQPSPTRLLADAAAAGCTTIDGLDLLAAQAELSFELWTGAPPPPNMMLAAARGACPTTESTPARSDIAIIGFMGSGKSAAGRLLARLTGKPLRDTDSLIIKRTGKSVNRIFAEEGETAFRKMESQVISQVAREGGRIIACGGGAVLDEDNMRALKKRAWVVYLRASPESILKRVSSSRNRRPLLQVADRAATVRSLLEYRKPIYEKWADIIIDTDDRSTEDITGEILTRIRQYEDNDF
jgi:shikimate dehydrogenase